MKATIEFTKIMVPPVLPHATAKRQRDRVRIKTGGEGDYLTRLAGKVGTVIGGSQSDDALWVRLDEPAGLPAADYPWFDERENCVKVYPEEIEVIQSGVIA